MPSRSANLPDIALEHGCDVVQKLIWQARELQALLLRERSALEERASTDLLEVAECKQACLQSLESNIAHQAHFLERPPRKACGQQLQGSNLPAQSRTFLALWAELDTVLRQCRHQNSANGELIRALRCHTSGMLSLIQGTLPGNDIYDGSGRRCATKLSSYSNTA